MCDIILVKLKGLWDISHKPFYRGYEMDKKQFLFGILFALGLFLVASYSIDNRGFHSGIYGIIGSGLIFASYVGLNLAKLKEHDHHTQRILMWLSILLMVIIILDIAEALLA